jgi:hypothetical protein
MSSGNHPGGKARSVHKADNLTAICEPVYQDKCGSPYAPFRGWLSENTDPPGGRLSRRVVDTVFSKFVCFLLCPSGILKTRNTTYRRLVIFLSSRDGEDILCWVP